MHPLLVVPESARSRPRPALARLNEIVAAAGVDGQLMTIVDRSVLHGALRVGRSQEATLVLVAEPSIERRALRRRAPLAAAQRPQTTAQAPPVALVRGNAERLGVVRTRLDDDERRLRRSSTSSRAASRGGRGAAARRGSRRLVAAARARRRHVRLGRARRRRSPGCPAAADGLVISTVAEWLIREEESSADSDDGAARRRADERLEPCSPPERLRPGRSPCRCCRR